MEPKCKMSKEENIFLAKRNAVDYIWKSANLEGIGVTYPDTQAIYNNMSVGGYTIDEINSVSQLKHAWQHLLMTLDEPLDLSYIKSIHRVLGKMTIINAGSLRMTEARIGGTDWIPEIPDAEKIEERLKVLMKNQDSLDGILSIVLFLMRSQMFYDGNKRISMLIGNKLMIQNGYGIISVPQKCISDFYAKLISFYETNEGNDLKIFIYEKCIDYMQF